MDNLPLPLPLPPPPGPPVILYSVGDIGVTYTSIITPNGHIPLDGSAWIVTEQTTIVQVMPGYAVVLAIVGLPFCLLGLLFLAIRQDRLSGHVQVAVQNRGAFYATQVPVSKPQQVAAVQAQVNDIRGLVAQAASWGR